MARNSLYWDDFERRSSETAECVLSGRTVPVRRVAIFVTSACNFRCRYCNVQFSKDHLSQAQMESVLEKYGNEPIYHITGGEPSTVSWLYRFLKEHGSEYRFHLNTNAYLMPPAQSVRRLKISLDSCDAESWDELVGRKGAFARVTDNIKKAIPDTVVSLTFTLSRRTYTHAIEFARFVAREFPGLYAVFFSAYKGCDPEFAWTEEDASAFFDMVPTLKAELNDESSALLDETLNEKRRLIQGVRFQENVRTGPCYLSMSERVISPNGSESLCSHLYRDGVQSLTPAKHPKCAYGCNRRLVLFNRTVEQLMKKTEAA